MNYKLEPPDARMQLPFEDIEVGQLLRGNSDPSQPDYHSKTMWQAKGNILEIRIPWMLLGFSDPSSHRVINYEAPNGNKLELSRTEGIRILPWMVKKGWRNRLGR